jgi:molybdopterin synthase sulfur carrier subunit
MALSTPPKAAPEAAAIQPAGEPDPLTDRQFPLRLRVRLFAGLREAMGWGDHELSGAEGTTPLSLWSRLGLDRTWAAADGSVAADAAATAAPGAVATPLALPAGIRVTINQRFAAADALLADGDEVAFLPPISGG